MEAVEQPGKYSIDSWIRSVFEGYSREDLIDLLVLYGRLYMLLDGQWYLSVKERLGNERAIEIDLEVWSKQGRREVEGLAKAMGVKSRDVVSFMRVFVTIPSSTGSLGYVEVKDRNDCALIVTRCPILNTLVKEGKGREKTQCEVVCRRLMTTTALYFNPEIRVGPTSMPAARRQSEECCRWWFRIEQSQR
jgi:hypothetical protein